MAYKPRPKNFKPQISSENMKVTKIQRPDGSVEIVSDLPDGRKKIQGNDYAYDVSATELRKRDTPTDRAIIGKAQTNSGYLRQASQNNVNGIVETNEAERTKNLVDLQTPSTESMINEARANEPDVSTNKEKIKSLLGVRDEYVDGTNSPKILAGARAFANSAAGLAAFASLGYVDTPYVKGIKDKTGDMMTTINENIKLIETGDIDYAQVIGDIDTAISLNEKLYTESKRKGVAQLTYWLGLGKDIEGFSLEQRKRLNNLRAAAVNADNNCNTHHQTLLD